MQFISLARRRFAAVSFALVALAAASTTAWAAPSRDNLTLLIPDNAVLTSWQVQVWTDAAAEEGIQIKTITDSAFLALGTTAANKIAGLVMPDSAHIQASDALVAAVKQYVSSGGKLMLTYDAGALTDGGFYALAGKSRFSDLVGVDYVQYETLRERVVGFGPIVGSKARMNNLLVPPGKYLPYAAPTVAAVTTAFVPTNRFDPGGADAMRSMVEARARRSWSQPFNPLRYDRRVDAATPAMRLPGSYPYRYSDDVGAKVDSTGSYWQENPTGWVSTQLTEDDKSLQTISGYGFPALSYYHYVTTGTFPGNVFLSSPDHGLVAGERTYGNGKVLFVNIPLGYFTAIGTDGMLLHGFLNHFARDQVVMPQVSVQPKGVGGLIYDWHVDDKQALNYDLGYVMGQYFMSGKGPFNFEFTAGPDVSAFGDGLGMDLANNYSGQSLVRYAGRWNGNLTHEIGAHGGWIHNIFGINANETNDSIYLPWVKANVGVVQNVMGKPSRSYSAPQGNNPLWAIKWLETYGIVGMYSVSNTGTAATREWRSGARVANTMWAMPIAPRGTAATFEEFAETGVTDGASAQWLVDLQSFVVNNRTNRLFYNHPPGARDHLNVVKTFVNRAENLKNRGRFNWYTMTQIADFNQRRIQTTWNTSTNNYGLITFAASNPVSLTDVTWLLPRSKYTQPYVTSGYGWVNAYDDTNWVVTARGGNNLSFKAYER
jgi:hypothetical protein|nr:hypothetical protein [uncultured Albidiferax sp.]